LKNGWDVFADCVKKEYEKEEWHDVTAYGDAWEVELDARSNTYRHRPLSFTERREEWRNGRPPSGVHAT
jgi:hypothetical protein